MIPEVHLREHIHFAVAIRDRGLFIRFHYSYLIRVRHLLLIGIKSHYASLPHAPKSPGKLQGMYTYISLLSIQRLFPTINIREKKKFNFDTAGISLFQALKLVEEREGGR